MQEIRYESSNGESISFTDNGVSVSGGTFLDWEYEEETLNDRIYSLQKDIRDITVAIDIKRDVKNKANEIADILSADSELASRGKLYVGDWYVICIPKGSEKDTTLPALASMTLTFVTDDPAWRRDVINSLPAYADQTEGASDYPMDTPWDYSLPKVDHIESEYGGDFKMVIQGACSSPAVTIGDNTYSFDVDLEDGEHLVVSSYGTPSIIKVFESGSSINAFSTRQGVQKKGSGSYAFEPIVAGRQKLVRSSNFPIEVTVMESRNERKWS